MVPGLLKYNNPEQHSASVGNWNKVNIKLVKAELVSNYILFFFLQGTGPKQRRLPYKPSKDLRHIRVVSPRLGDGDTQFSIAHGAEGTDPPAADPDDERQAHRACMLQHSFRRDEYPRADDVPWGN